MDWLRLGCALLVFLASHAVLVRPPVRPLVERRLGSRGFGVAYSALSVALLSWLIVEARSAPFVPLWPTHPWQTHTALLLMLAACLLLGLAIGRPNPFSFGGLKNAAFDPKRPGLVGYVRHPLLAVLTLWSAAHMLVNGDLAHVIMFGTFLAFSLLGGHLIDRRKRRQMGEEWDALKVALLRPSFARPSLDTTARVLLGLAVFVGLVLLHPIVIGVDPLALGR